MDGSDDIDDIEQRLAPYGAFLSDGRNSVGPGDVSPVDSEPIVFDLRVGRDGPADAPLADVIDLTEYRAKRLSESASKGSD